MRRNLICVSLAIVFSASASAWADVRVAALFGDHMILQQDVSVPVWGWADPGETVEVRIGDRTGSATAGADGKWRVELQSIPAAAAPQTLTVAGHNTLKFEDVLVGDVWLASGQSNMGFSLNAAHNAETEIPKATDSQIRFFSVAHRPAAEPQAETSGHWEVCTPKTASGFSAVAYFFARDLRAEFHRPVGLIGSYWGGTPAQAWTALASLRQDPPMTKYVNEYEKALEAHKAVLADPKLEADYVAQEKEWKSQVAPKFDAETKAYNRAADAARAAGSPPPAKPKPARPEPANPDPTGVPSSGSRPSAPAVLFNGMIAPCAPYAIKGVIWYQGEANGSAGLEYRTLFPRLITGWRAAWGQGDFPFLYVQLPGWAASGKDRDDWAYLREAQAMTLSLPNTGMAVTIDIGDPDNVHPKDKIDVGQRLALVARKVAYGQDVVCYGPTFASMKVEGNGARIEFTNTGGGLIIAAPPWTAPGSHAPPTDKLVGFAVAGEDHHWFPADARIDGKTVVVSSPQVPRPVAVRYGWSNSPVCNLYNRDHLPAAPFRTDDWPAAKP